MGEERALQRLEKFVYYIPDVGTTDDLVTLFEIFLNEIITN